MVEKPESSKHLVRLIQSWVKLDQDNIPPSQKDAQRLVGVCVLSSMLDGLQDEEGSSHLILKGGNSLIVRFGNNARPTRDIDTLTDLDINKAFDLIETRLVKGWDNFTGRIVRRENISRANTAPLPQRCEIKLSYLGKSFTTLIFEISQINQNLDDKTEFVANAIDLSPILLESSKKIPLLNVHDQIAQKIHACTEILDDETNVRVHDLFDICLLEELAVKDLKKTKLACIETFTERDSHEWPPELPTHTEWENIWEKIQTSNEVQLSYQEARNRISNLINIIDQA